MDQHETGGRQGYQSTRYPWTGIAEVVVPATMSPPPAYPIRKCALLSTLA